MADGGRRPDRPAAEFEVLERTQRNAHTVRIVVADNGRGGFAHYRDNDFTDKYVKLLFTDAEGDPVRRTYTVRRSEPAAGRLSLDFVVHGDAGVAAPWARSAAPGDVLRLNGAGGAYRPAEDVAAHVFLADESALPAVSAALEVLPANARGLVVLEVSDRTDALDVEVPAGVEIVWLERPEPGTTPERLAEVLAGWTRPTGPVDVFAHGERESMKAVRKVLRGLTTDADHVSISGYWAYGRTEDRFQAEKREPVGSLDG